MKTIKAIAAILSAFLFISTASAAMVIKITGSNVFRNAVYFGIIHNLNSPTAAAVAPILTANRVIISGTVNSGPLAGQAAVFQIAWSENASACVITQSLTTMNACTYDSAHTWLSATNTLTPVSIAGSTIVGVNVLGAPAFDAAATPDVSGLNCCQSDTSCTIPVLTELSPNSNGDPGVGVAEYEWLKSVRHPDIPAASYAAFQNISRGQAQLFLAAGNVQLSYFTSIPADTGYDALLAGLDIPSGTRTTIDFITAECCSPAADDNYQAVIGGGLITAVINPGNPGYCDSSGVLSALTTPAASGSVDDSGKPFLFVGYLAKVDVPASISSQVLTWNGVPESPAAVENGSYSLWSYYHLYYRTTIPASKKILVDQISTQIRNVDAVQSGILLSAMLVHRTCECGVISP